MNDDQNKQSKDYISPYTPTDNGFAGVSGDEIDDIIRSFSPDRADFAARYESAGGPESHISGVQDTFDVAGGEGQYVTKGSEEYAPLEAEATQTRRKSGATALTDVYDWLQCVVVAVTVCVLLFVFGLRSVDVIGPSMTPTLLNGNRVVLSTVFYKLRQGDIVVLKKEEFMDTPIIKRVIATEGQTVDIDFEKGVVLVDGVELVEPYVNSPTTNRLSFSGPMTVPAGCVFVLGDNRNDSRDSRDSQIGMVDTRLILGKTMFRILPLKEFGAIPKNGNG